LRPSRHVPTALALAALLAACSATPPSNGDSDGEPRTIEIHMSDELRYNPADINVAAGETVRFLVTNDGETVHEFLIGDEAAQAEFAAEMAAGDSHGHTDAGVTVEPGQSETFEYTFDDTEADLLAGCHEPGHYEGGMVASINIADPS